MCIRDRYEAIARALKYNLDHQVELAEQSVRERELALSHYSCLLYTSDAADERSSVDLGGRRIIKKKKTENIHGNG